MWIFLNYAFFSVTESPDAPGVLQVRARDKRDLQDLKARHGLKNRIIETPKADYRFRLIIPPQRFADIMAAEVLAIDYCNFKDSCTKRMKTRPLLSVWSAMASVQWNAHREKSQPPLFFDDPAFQEARAALDHEPPPPPEAPEFFPDYEPAGAKGPDGLYCPHAAGEPGEPGEPGDDEPTDEPRAESFRKLYELAQLWAKEHAGEWPTISELADPIGIEEAKIDGLWREFALTNGNRTTPDKLADIPF